KMEKIFFILEDIIFFLHLIIRFSFMCFVFSHIILLERLDSFTELFFDFSSSDCIQFNSYFQRNLSPNFYATLILQLILSNYFLNCHLNFVIKLDSSGISKFMVLLVYDICKGFEDSFLEGVSHRVFVLSEIIFEIGLVWTENITPKFSRFFNLMKKNSTQYGLTPISCVIILC
ncbi:hypothetical protein L9F63_010329, partial [Diploptera punctata]